MGNIRAYKRDFAGADYWLRRKNGGDIRRNKEYLSLIHI